jgi:hypothetical protein
MKRETVNRECVMHGKKPGTGFSFLIKKIFVLLNPHKTFLP